MNYFGTDGIRGKREIFTEGYLQILAASLYATAKVHRFVIGRDTRIGGEKIAKTLANQLAKYGAEVYYLGITPTPVVSLCTVEYGCCYGIIISASHNPPEYNGIKICNKLGEKLSEEDARMIEEAIDNPPRLPRTNGGIISLVDGDALYLKHVFRTFSPRLHGKSVLLDCACGATYRLAPMLFRMLGAEVTTMFNESDGININRNCGATAPQAISELSINYDFAFSFDGDGDRILAYAKGKRINGDHIIYIIAKYLKEWNALPANAVVGTIMSNIGLDHALRILNIDLIRVGVGDQLVYDKMQEIGASVGGESSGHIILRDYLNTGDGIFTAIMLANIGTEKELVAFDDMQDFPQFEPDITTTNTAIAAFKKDEDITHKVAELNLNLSGRLVVRASGTEPKIRIMAEAKTLEKAKSCALQAKEYIISKLNIK